MIINVKMNGKPGIYGGLQTAKNLSMSPYTLVAVERNDDAPDMQQTIFWIKGQEVTHAFFKGLDKKIRLSADSKEPPLCLGCGNKKAAVVCEVCKEPTCPDCLSPYVHKHENICADCFKEGGTHDS